MPRTLADGNIRFDALLTAPAGLAAGGTISITTDELAAAVRLAPRTLKTEHKMTAEDSDTVNEPLLSSDSNAPVFGASNYAASTTVFRFLQSSGAPDVLEDVAWTTMETKGTNLYLVERTGPREATDWAAGDTGELYWVITDQPKAPSAVAGFIKRVIGMGVQGRWKFVVTGTSTVPLLTSATPSAVAATGLVTIAGSRFTGTTGVTIGGTAATAFTVLSDHLLVATMPAGSAGSAPIIVTNAGGASAAFAYTRGA